MSLCIRETGRRAVSGRTLGAVPPWARAGLLWAAAAGSIPCLAQSEPTRSEVVVRALSSEEFEVNARYPSGLNLRSVAYSGSDTVIEAIQAERSGRPLEIQLDRRNRYLGLRLEEAGDPGAGLEIRYRVSSRKGRLPLFAPLNSDWNEGGLRIQLKLAPGLRLAGESFPRFEEAGGAYEAVLSDSPSLLLIPVRSEGLGGRVWTVGLMTNIGLFGLTFSFASCWWWLRRKRAPAIGEEAGEA